MARSASDELDQLAKILNTTRAELVRAIVRASHRDWLKALKRELAKQAELGEVDPWHPED